MSGQRFVESNLNLPTYKGNPAQTFSAAFMELQRQWRQMAYAVNNLTYYAQDAEPVIALNTMALWKDTDGSPNYYLLANFDGTQKKVELT